MFVEGLNAGDDVNGIVVGVGEIDEVIERLFDVDGCSILWLLVDVTGVGCNGRDDAEKPI